MLQNRLKRSHPADSLHKHPFRACRDVPRAAKTTQSRLNTEGFKRCARRNRWSFVENSHICDIQGRSHVVRTSQSQNASAKCQSQDARAKMPEPRCQSQDAKKPRCQGQDARAKKRELRCQNTEVRSQMQTTGAYLPREPLYKTSDNSSKTKKYMVNLSRYHKVRQIFQNSFDAAWTVYSSTAAPHTSYIEYIDSQF